jgi:Mrp family chromosome partitioning ATPase
MVTLEQLIRQGKNLPVAKAENMSDHSLAPISSPLVQVVRSDATGPPEERAPFNPLIYLRVLLHGRYLHAILLALLLGTCAALAAWFLIPVKYEIVGYVQIKPYVPKVLYQSDENGFLPSFETFVELQASLLQSQRVLDRASQNPDWTALRPASTTLGANGISTDDLIIGHSTGSELITVTAAERDLNAAMAAVKSILQAYLEISGETNGAEDAHRLQVLEDLRVSLANEAHGLHDRVLAVANEFGTDDLSQRYQMKVAEVSTLESELQQINLDLSIAQATPGQVPTTDPLSHGNVAAATSEDMAPLTREDVAEVDTRMRNDLAQEDALSLRLVQLRMRFGENNDDVRAASAELAFLETRINALLAVYQQRSIAKNPSANGSDNRSRMSSAELTAQQANVRALYEKVQAAALDLGRKDLQLRSLKQEEAAITRRLDEASNRIDQLNLEANSAERISILSYGERPTTPPKSKRAPLTAAAGLGGIGAGIGIVALWGLVSRRVRSVLQVQHLEPTVRMLGVLPALPELADPEQESLAAHCIHQIRNLLDTGDRSRGRVLAVTSPAAGDGKTSLTLALGLSFATAGSRTLLVDCDMVGQGLTGRLNAIARRGIGSILQRDGLLTDAQLEEAQGVANSTSRKLSAVLVDGGYVTELDVQRALLAEGESSVGLLDALDGDDVSTCVTQILTKDLSILPLGEAAIQQASQMSSRAFRRIIGDARNLFDVIIVDTGPILGSLEASIVVREVDEVVVAVARDGQAPLIKRAITRLDSLGARFAGLVFNRASSKDVAFAYYGSSPSTASVRSTGETHSRVRKESDASTRYPSRLGSLAAAVVSSSSGGSEKETNDDSHVNRTNR